MPTREQIMHVLRQVNDPELGVSIVDLGLVYDIEIKNADVYIKMTLTTPGCPLTSYLSAMVETAIRQALSDIKNVEIELVWDPPWDPSRMTEVARKKLGWHPKES